MTREMTAPQLRGAVAQVPRLGVVLAAGRSERLSAVTGGGSKALVRLAGVPLVERAVRSLLHAGVEQVLVIVGYQAGPVAAVVKRIAPGRVRAVYARDWRAGNGASLLAAERFLGPQDELFVLVTMDHVFGGGALEVLARIGSPAVLVDPSPHREVWAEGTRVRIRRDAAHAFSKELDDPSVDCGAFVLPGEVFDGLRHAAQRDDHSLSGALTVLARARPLRAIPLPPGSWWQDVDTPQDLDAAKRGLRRSLKKTGDGPVSRYLNRPLSTRLSMLIAPLGVPADVLSFVSASLGVFGAWLLAAGSGLGGALAVHGCSVLDGVDGEVARLRQRAGPRGALLDGVLDRVTDAAVIAGLGLWALHEGASAPTVVVVVVAAAAGTILSMASKDRVTALGLFPAPERALGWLAGGRDGRLMLVALFAALGRPMIALVAVVAATAATLLLRVVAVLRHAD